MPETREIRLKGRAVSRGVGMGPAVCIFGDRRQFLRRQIDASEVESEISRYEDAAASARSSLDIDVARNRELAGDRAAEVLEGHLLILQDPALDSSIKKSITGDRTNAEWAVQYSIDRFSESLKSGGGSRIREKYLDIEDVADRLLFELSGLSTLPQLDSGAVVIASELRASTLLQLRDSGVAGIVTEHGGWTSHSSILAREFGIPYVTGIPHLFQYIDNNTVAAVDGNNGEVVFDPSENSLAHVGPHTDTTKNVPGRHRLFVDPDLRTLDGRSITLRTNTTSLDSYEIAEMNGAKGIGLYRSEALIGKYGRIPNEDEQTEEYLQITAAVGVEGVRIRTFDIESERRQRNPALGLRAIRLGLLKPEIMIPQIRALLRASAFGNVKIVVPMVNDVSQMTAIRRTIAEQSIALGRSGVRVGAPEIGAMIEVPSAALLADQIACGADFLCLGTNDLAQYILAADRDNENVSDWFRTLHPAMLRIVKTVIHACHEAKKPFIVCGEMAGSPFYVPVLIGMGADELSVGPASIESVRRVIAGIAFEEAADLVREVMKYSNPDEVERAVAETAKAKWLHLYPSGFFEQHGR